MKILKLPRTTYGRLAVIASLISLALVVYFVLSFKYDWPIGLWIIIATISLCVFSRIMAWQAVRKANENSILVKAAAMFDNVLIGFFLIFLLLQE